MPSVHCRRRLPPPAQRGAAVCMHAVREGLYCEALHRPCTLRCPEAEGHTAPEERSLADWLPAPVAALALPTVRGSALQVIGSHQASARSGLQRIAGRATPFSRSLSPETHIGCASASSRTMDRGQGLVQPPEPPCRCRRQSRPAAACVHSPAPLPFPPAAPGVGSSG